MDSLEDGEKVSVKSLASKFCEKELSGASAGCKEKSKRERSDHERPDKRTDSSLKDFPHFSNRTERSDHERPDYKTDSSLKDFPHFSDRTMERPNSADSQYKTDSSLKDFPHFSNKPHFYGLPHYWAGQVKSSMGPPKFNVPPAAAYPVLTTDRRAPDDFCRSRTERPRDDYADYRTESSLQDFPHFDDKFLYQDYPWETKAAFSSASDFSSVKTYESRNIDQETVCSNDIQKKVICDICREAAAVKICLTCNTSLCEFDGRPHYTVTALRRHILTDVSDEVERKRCLHDQNSLEFFCRTDQIPICKTCAQGTHRGHDIIKQKAQRAQRHQALSDLEEDKDLTPPHKVVPPPGAIQFLSVKPHSVVLSWGCPEGPEAPKCFRVKWSSSGKEERSLIIKDLHKVEINNLQLGQKYVFSVAREDKDGSLSEWVLATVFTAVPSPRHLTKEHSEATALSLKWITEDSMEGIPHQFLIIIESPGKDPQAIYTEDHYKKFSDLEPDTEYTIYVSTVVNDRCSERVFISIHTDPSLREVLSVIGLEDEYDTKLTLNTVLEINQYDTSSRKPETPKELPAAFLKGLMSLNTNARSVKCLPCDADPDKWTAMNPLDLITALFLCSDSLLQQDLVLKMSLCQFAVPLLLPNSETREIKMMLWSMRDIVRTFRPSQQAFQKMNCEERLVLSHIPLVSFVRLGKKSLSKSQMLNRLLSNSQHIHDTFCHRNMECGDVPRRISNGLVEISWYLPAGNRSIDKFTEPLTVANLRGDIRAFDKQFSFLCQASAAVYIFCDESETEYFKNLKEKRLKGNIFLISGTQGKTYKLKMLNVKLSLKMTDVSQVKKTDADLLKALQESVSKILESNACKVSIASLADVARCNEILVDEDSDECQSAWKNVDEITAHITESSEFKNNHLPCQGNIWKAISWVETEYWRLRKVGNHSKDQYFESLKLKEKELRMKQQRFGMTPAMVSFHHGTATSEVQRYYFLKGLETELDDLSRNQLSALQDQYKELRQKSPKESEQIADTDMKISDCSLRMYHFFRECGQLYKCASHLPDYSRQRKNLEQFPALCAQILLDGFPLELVDGDAGNIPMKWITDVLTKLHEIMHSNSTLKVITVIGAENSGKSTLLNTMFGARFAVSKGTCTRGAFIQLITVNKDVRKELGCDCIMIIDTEGLKPHQMVQDDYSHERDKEVASLAVALSDAVIVSVSTDSFGEKDILTMVLHAFTRLKNVKKKPLCNFVHMNMSDISALESLKRDRQLMQQLNERIQKDAKMKKANINKISAVMKIEPNAWSWDIPPVWNGNPPMAPFSAAYSEAVHDLKKSLLMDLKNYPARGDLMEFIKMVESFWKAL